MGSGRGPGMTLDQIGGVLDLTRERIRQIEAQAVVTLRDSGEATTALELMHMRSSGQLDGASAAAPEPEGGPIITAQDRRRVMRAYQKLVNARICQRVGCKRPARTLYVYGGQRGVPIDGHYCSYSCRRRDQANGKQAAS